MARSSLSSVVDGTFVNRFRGLASGAANSSTQLSQALNGSAASSTSFSDGLRFGARTFATALKSLNSAGAVVQISKDTLGALEGLTDKLIAVSERAGKSSTGQNQRDNLDREFQEIGAKFQKIVENAKFGERDVLTVNGLTEVLQAVGLDNEQSESIAKVIDEFVVPAGDDHLASEEIQGERPVKVPVVDGKYARVSAEFSALFAPEANIRGRADALRMTADLKALKGQIQENIGTVDDVLTTLQDNVELVRATGLAFLGLSQGDSIADASTADQVASSLRDEIRRHAKPAYLAQAENLQNIVVAALALTQE